LIKSGTHRKNILVIQARPGIGDMCVFLPCIKEIGKKYSNYDLHILTKKRSYGKDFLKYDKCIKKIFYLPEEAGIKLNYSILKFIRQNKYQKCFIMHYSLRYYFLSLLANVKKIYFYGFFKKKESIVYRSQKSTKQWLKNESLVFEPKIFYKNNIQKIDQITFGIGGSGFNKKWDIEKYIQLAELINKQKKFNILLAGGPEEINNAKYISQKLNSLKISTSSICEKKICDCIDYLVQSKIYIGNDTGFMHLSGCLGIRSYGLFGDTPPDYASYNKNIFAITPNGSSKITHGSGMMDKIKADYVFDQISTHIC